MCSLFADPSLLGAAQKLCLALVDDLLFLLADGLDAGIAACHVAGAETVEHTHHLSLVSHHAIGFTQHLFHEGMLTSRLFAAVLAIDIGVYHARAERAGSIQGIGSDEIADVVGL